MAFKYKSHGGLCCGMHHLHNIPAHSEQTEENLRQLCLRYSSNQRVPPTRKTIALEMIFTDQKLKRGWKEALARLGFKRTIRWSNPNTGNFLNHYILCLEAPPVEGYQQEN